MDDRLVRSIAGGCAPDTRVRRFNQTAISLTDIGALPSIRLRAPISTEGYSLAQGVFVAHPLRPRTAGAKRVLRERIVLTAPGFFHIPMFFLSWGIFLTAAVISWAMQIRLADQRASFLAFLKLAFPLASWRKKTARMDVFLYLLTKLTNKFLSPFHICTVTVFGITIGLLESHWPAHDSMQPHLAILLLASFVAFLIVDFANFLTHYMQHFVPVLWELHKVHHSATFLSPVTTERMHPLGNAFDGLVSGSLVGIPFGIFGFLFGMNIPDLLLLLGSANTIGTIFVLDSLRHSQFPVSFGRFDKVLLSPHMHQLHHSCRLEHWDKNFGNKLSVWDWVFGTAYLPARDEFIPYGLGKPEENDYNNLLGACIGPLQKIYSLLRQSSDGRKSFPEGILWRHRSERRSLYRQGADRARSCADVGQVK